MSDVGYALRSFLDAHRLGSGPVTLTRIGEGHSNLTFLVERDGGSRYVLRRPPPPPPPLGMHDIAREVRILMRLRDVPVPRVLAHDETGEVIGVPFYVMEYLDGHVLVDALPQALSPAAERRRIGEATVDALVALHAVDVRAAGLADFGRPDSFVERQLGRTVRLWEQMKTREVPAFNAIRSWLQVQLPPPQGATVLHGDYRLGNLIFARQAPARLLGILDWEIASLGDPLVDLGYLSAYWVQPDDPPLRIFDLGAVLRDGGFLTRAEIVQRYTQGTGRDLSSLRFYEVFAFWRLAAMMQSNYKRARDGVIESQYLLGYEEGSAEMIERAAWLAGLGPEPQER
ncbi:MAG: phosphotransferase family protein [Pseudomonadota bacterium]|nr:phosphotransferase family protein [Pseudomonadota bacterium]